MAKISAGLDFRWLRPDDRLLSKVVSWNDAMVFSGDPAERNALMLKGYFRAGHILIDQCRENLNEGHLLIYPILFCYRHALEMAMKDLLESYGHRFGVSVPGLDHNLWRLWESCRAIFAQIDNQSVATDTSIVERLIKEFHDLDARAEAFRYPVKKDGTVIDLPNDAFNLTDLRGVVESLENFFSGADGYLDELCSASDEMQYYGEFFRSDDSIAFRSLQRRLLRLWSSYDFYATPSVVLTLTPASRKRSSCKEVLGGFDVVGKRAAGYSSFGRS
jgi:hypothetical protein